MFSSHYWFGPFIHLKHYTRWDIVWQQRRRTLWKTLTDLRDLHSHRVGCLLRCHVPPPSFYIDERSDAAGVVPSVFNGHPPHPQPVVAGFCSLQARLPLFSLRSAGGCVWDHHPAAIHGDDFTAVGQPGHFQGEGGQVVGGDAAHQGQRVARREDERGGGGRGGGWGLHVEGTTLRGQTWRQSMNPKKTLHEDNKMLQVSVLALTQPTKKHISWLFLWIETSCTEA